MPRLNFGFFFRVANFTPPSLLVPEWRPNIHLKARRKGGRERQERLRKRARKQAVLAALPSALVLLFFLSRGPDLSLLLPTDRQLLT